MLSKLAVATDGSGTAQQAVDAAFELAGRYDAEVLILTAYSGDAAVNGVWAASSATHAERVLAIAEEAAEARGLRHSSAMLEGEPAEVIVGLAERHGVDMLVVGSVGMQRRVLGSVPNTVTHKATCHVFVVKTD